MIADIWTVGQGRHDTPGLINLLREHSIDRLVDIRRTPKAPDDRPDLSIRRLPGVLSGASLEYEYMGDHLGGQPTGKWDCEPGGRPNYREMARSGQYLAAMRALTALASAERTALFCVEENPYVCHRHRMLAPTLESIGFVVRHIRKDGAEEYRADIKDGRQGELWAA